MTEHTSSKTSNQASRAPEGDSHHDKDAKDTNEPKKDRKIKVVEETKRPSHGPIEPNGIIDLAGGGG